jgi:alpha-amylase
MKKLTAIMLCASLSACMSFDGLEEQVVLQTHVEDWRDQVIYQVLIDRFANGDHGNDYSVDTTALARWHGGDWAGLESQLDYLDELGVTALWISPVYRNVDTDANVDGYHGYWPQDFTAPNNHFGDLMALRSMVKAAHERGILVIIDVVTNHVGQLFFYDINLNGHPDEQTQGGKNSPVVHINEYDPDFDPRGIQAETSLGEAGLAPIVFVHDPATNHMPPVPEVLRNPAVYNRRGRTLNFDDPDQLLHGDFPGGLKDLDTTRCDVKEAMVESYARWVEWTDVDGFRIDTIKHVEYEFWRYFAQKIRQRLASQGKTNFFMFGEAFDGNPPLVGSFTKNDPPSPAELENENACVYDGREITGDLLDGVFHFPQYFQGIRDVFQESQSTDRVQALWEDMPNLYGLSPHQLGTGLPPISTVVNFIDNHDVPRFLFQSDQASLHLAMLFTMTARGIPCIYYGTEQGFSGGNDPANREDMWLTGYDRGHPTYQWLKRLNTIRRAYPSLRRGEVSVTWSTPRVDDEEDAGILAYERTGGDAGASYALVIFNTNRNHDSTTAFEGAAMAVTAAAGSTLVDAIGGSSHTVAADGTLSVTLPPLSAVLLVPSAELVSGI